MILSEQQVCGEGGEDYEEAPTNSIFRISMYIDEKDVSSSLLN